MVDFEHPVARLATLAEQLSTGELVTISAGGETHLYLHRGRLAWAIDSRSPDGFARHLHETAGLSPETLGEVVDECRRARLPFGDTLVAWGLASTDALRLALRRQLRDTLARLARDRECSSVFLARTWAGYDTALTFTVDELGVVEDAAPPAAGPTLPEDLATRLRATIDGVRWVELLRDGALLESDPPSDTPRTPLELIARTLSDGAELVTLQTEDRALVGSTLADQLLWCCLAPDAPLGGAYFVLSSVTGSDRRTLAASPRSPRPTWSCGDDDVLRDFAAHHPEIHAVVVLGDDDELHHGLGHGPMERGRHEALVRSRRPALALGPGRASIGTAEPDAWCFGTRLADDLTLWLLLDRSTPQGLGWTLVAALARAWSRTRASALA